MKFRLQTKLLFFLLLVSVGLTTASLTVARRVVEKQARAQVFDDLRNSLVTFQNSQKQREAALARSAQLVANLPVLRALMTTEHAATIQDGSLDLWRMAGSSLFVVGARDGRLMALHPSSPNLDPQATTEALRRSLREEKSSHWWFLGHHLYEVSVQPIYFGHADDGQIVGYLAIGDEIDDGVAREVSQVAASQVAFQYGQTLVRSTLSLEQETELRKNSDLLAPGGVQEIRLGEEKFLVTSVTLSTDASSPAQLTVLKSVDQATAFLSNLYRNLMLLGVVTVLLGAVLVYWISHAFTRPLGNLVAGVRALEHGNYDYPLEAKSADEVAEVTIAFSGMRRTLQETQRKLLESERLATIGQMASSISHDLRHSLAGILANSEFLTFGRHDLPEREVLYQEIRVGVNQMTDLIDSLVEFSRTRESLRLTQGSLKTAIERAIHMVGAHPEYHEIRIQLCADDEANGYFDARRLERVFQNLLLNACEALPKQGGKIDVQLGRRDEGFDIRVIDNGRGVPEAVREKIFDPFVSQGKENGTGLGLTVVQKIVADHGGEVRLESSSSQGTTFYIFLPQITPLRTVAQESSVPA